VRKRARREEGVRGERRGERGKYEREKESESDRGRETQT